jgi:hypothetical protein
MDPIYCSIFLFSYFISSYWIFCNTIKSRHEQLIVFTIGLMKHLVIFLDLQMGRIKK